MTLPFSTRLALRQLGYKGFGLIAAFSGVCVAITLVFVQLGFKNALTGSVLNFGNALNADLVITSSQFETIAFTQPWIPRHLIAQAKGVEGIEKVVPLYVNLAQIRANEQGHLLIARFIAFDLADSPLNTPGLDAYKPALQLPYAALIDSRSRNALADVAQTVGAGQQSHLYLQSPAMLMMPRIDLHGTYTMGPDFTFPGGFIISDLNFHRLFRLPLDRVHLGLVTLAAGANPDGVMAALRSQLGPGIDVSRLQDFNDRERIYFVENTPVGIVTTVGMLVGILIGIVFVVEVLHSIIGSNMSEYAVLRAMGYGTRFFVMLVLQISLIIGTLAFLASLAITMVAYAVLAHTTMLTFDLAWSSAALVLLGTLTMSGVAVTIALRKLLRSNPIDLFA